MISSRPRHPRRFTKAWFDWQRELSAERDRVRAQRIAELASQRIKSKRDRARLAELRAAERARERIERARPQTLQRIERIKEQQQSRQLSREERTRRRYADKLERAYGDKYANVRDDFLELSEEVQDEIIAEARELRQQYIDNEYKTLGKPLNYMIFYHSPV